MADVVGGLYAEWELPIRLFTNWLNGIQGNVDQLGRDCVSN